MGYGYFGTMTPLAHYLAMHGYSANTGGRDYNRFLLLQNYLSMFCERFQYNGLPESLRELSANNNTLELMLFFSPSVAFFEDKVLGLQCLPTSGEYDYTITGMPTSWRVFGANGYNKRFTNNDSVLMFNDRAYTVPFLRTIYELGLMVDANATVKQEMLAHRRPLIMEIEEDERKSADKFISKLKDFDDVIKVRKKERDKKSNGMPFETKVFETSGGAFNGSVYIDFYKQIESRILTYYGIKSLYTEKRERLITSEASANDMIVQMNYSSALGARRDALEKVNKMFGTNITVEPNQVVMPVTQDNDSLAEVNANADNDI